MGRDLNGKEIGKGLVQEPNGLYKARYFHNSHVTSKRFKYLNDARRWLVDKSYEADHGISVNEYTTTYDEWFGYWLETVKVSNISYRIRTDYQALYDLHIKDYIGDFLVSEIKPINCLNVLVSMEKKGLANSYIQKARVIMHDSFESAFDNDLIRKNPIKKKVSAKGGQPKEKFIMDRKQEEMFLEYAKDYYYYPVFAFILQTGLRISELMGLKWSDIDLNTQTMKIERSVEFRKDLQKFAEKPPTQTYICDQMHRGRNKTEDRTEAIRSLNIDANHGSVCTCH